LSKAQRNQSSQKRKAGFKSEILEKPFRDYLFSVGLGKPIKLQYYFYKTTYHLEILNYVLLTRENLTPSEIDNMDEGDWSVYLAILNEIQKGEKHKAELEQSKAKSKSKK
jgi:hypothetical protein